MPTPEQKQYQYPVTRKMLAELYIAAAEDSAAGRPPRDYSDALEIETLPTRLGIEGVATAGLIAAALDMQSLIYDRGTTLLHPDPASELNVIDSIIDGRV